MSDSGTRDRPRWPKGWHQASSDKPSLSETHWDEEETQDEAETREILDWQRFFLDNSRALSLVPGSSLLLNDASSVYLVTAGQLDLYVNFLGEGEAAASRDYLLTVEADGVAMGLPASDVVQVVATGRGTAELREISHDVFQTLMQGADEAPQQRLAAGVDAWLLRLQEALERFAPAVDFVDETLAPGDSLELRPGQRLVGSEGIVWVRFDHAEVALLDGVEIFAHGEPACLPLGPKAWLTARTDLKLEAMSTGELHRAKAWLRWVEYFNRLALKLLRFHLGGAYKAEQERLERKASLLSAERSAMLARFRTVMDGGTRPVRALTPLVAACQRIGEELGVRVRDPEEEGLLDRPGPSVRARVEAISRRSRLRNRPVVLRHGWWRTEMASPMLAFWRDTATPIALLPGRGRRTQYWDPLAGDVQRRVTDEVAGRVDPAAYSFHRTLPDRPLRFADLFRLAFGFSRRDLGLVALCGVFGTLLSMLVPVAMGVMIDITIPAHQPEQLWRIGAALVVAAAAAFCFKVAEDIAMLRAQGKATATLQPAILDRLLRMPNTFFRRYSAGDLAERASTVDMVQDRLAGSALAVVLTGVFSTLNFGLMVYLDAGLAATAFGLVVLMYTAAVILVSRQRRIWAKVQNLRGEEASLILQMVSGMSRVRLAGAEDRMFVRWGNLSTQLRELIMRCFQTEARFVAFLRGFEILGLALVFAAFVRFDGERLSTGEFLAFIAAFTVAISGSSALCYTLLVLSDVIPLYDRIRPILENEPESETEKVHPGMLSGRIEANELVFRYGDGLPTVLDGLSFVIEPGQYVAVVGPSGCGKSTLFRMILGFENPQAGSIYFDGKDLAGLDLREVRHQIGVVLQQDKLMDASIFENIRGDAAIHLEEAWTAARMAGIADDVEAMPLGMHTPISAQGGDLSGGQAQRLLIARALASRPRILLLDEATSALDNQAQAVVTESLERLRVTRIAIAHRLSTVKKADSILVLDGGRVVESGGYEELMEKDGFFAELVRRQLL